MKYNAAMATAIILVLSMLLVLGGTSYPHAASANATAANSIANSTTVPASISTPVSSTTSTVSSSTTTVAAMPNATDYTLVFKTTAGRGSIVFNGTAYFSGNTIQVQAGNYPISTAAKPNFAFGNWSYAGNITVASPNSQSTNVSVSGNGTITANFDALTTFSENSLPANAVWSVVYGGVAQNAIAPNSITFSTLPGNYMFDIANETAGSTVYTPELKSGHLEAGSAAQIHFIPASLTSIVASTTAATTTVVIPFQLGNNTVPAPLSNQSVLENQSFASLINTLHSRLLARPPKKGPVGVNNIVEVMEAKGSEVGLGAVPGNIGIFNGTQKLYSENVLIAYANRTLNNGAAKTASMKLYSASVGSKVISYASAIPAHVRAPILISPGSYVSSITVETSSNESLLITNVSMSLRPNNITNFKKPVYSEFKISSTLNDSNVVNAEYNFSVNKTWINNLGISPSQVTLYKYINARNMWIALPTHLTGQNQTSYMFSAISNSLSTYLVSFTGSGVAGDANPESITLPLGYKTYICGAGANYTFSTSGTAFTWTQDVGAPSGAPINNGENASIGHQSSNVCSAYTNGAAYPGLAVAGIGVNAIYYKIFSTGAGSSSSDSLSYTIATSNSFVVLVGAAGYYNFTTITIPSSCTKQTRVDNIDTYETAYVATCQNAASGSYTFSASLSFSGSSALAAYVFPPGDVILDDNPSTATITTNGNTYSNGQTMQVIGTNAITATPPATGNWVFNSWSVSNSNLTLSSTNANPSTLTVMGNGIVTATWNGISKFVETGLPSSTTWNVIYDGILNSSSTNTISFSTLPGNYLFTVANQIVSGTTYVPSPSSGYLVAGSTTAITFSAVTQTCTISLNPSAIDFGSLAAGSSIPTTNAITDDNTGNANAYMLVYGGNWIGTAQFGVSNTTWAASSGVQFGSASKLSATPANTLLSVPASGSNTIYFGLGVPGGAPAGPYAQTITIENSC